MTSPWLLAIGSVAIVSLISLIGIFTLLLRRQILSKAVFVLVALSVGALFGDVFIHVLPEVYESGLSPQAMALWVIGGMLIFFVLEKFFRWSHHHPAGPEAEALDHLESAQEPLGYLNLAADGVHNLIDGIAIGIAYLVSPPVGVATTLAVILHEIPQEIGDFGVLLHAGFSVKKALLLNLLSALLAVVGVVTALVIGNQLEGATPYILALAAGGFIYIAGSDLVPELHKSVGAKTAMIQLGAIVVGVSLMLLLTLLE